MKKLTILTIVLLFFVSPVKAEEDEDGWELNPDASNSESYNNVSGSYKGFNFFSADSIKKSEHYAETEKEKIKDIQNKVMLEEAMEAEGFEELEDLIWNEPIAVDNIAIVKEESYVLYYVIFGGIVVLFAALFSREHYKKKRKRSLENDNS
jgi:hypothetical protein